MDSSLDPENTMESFLDPENTMDYALFKKVRTRFMFQTESHESMVEVVESLVDQRIYDDGDLRLPPLAVILHRDLVEPAWGWDRLLPWMSGSCLFEDYFDYLGDYFRRNLADVGKFRDFDHVAKKCIEAEDALVDAIGKNGGNELVMSITRTRDHHALSKRISFEADRIMALGSAASTVVAAGLMCILEEAKLMSELLTRSIKEADASTTEVCRLKFEFGYGVREAALDILTNYRGPYGDEVSASLLGMQKEAIIARELLDRQDHVENHLVLSEEIRGYLLELLIIIRDCLPMESSIKYRHKIGIARAAVKNRLKDLRLVEREVKHVGVDVVNSSGISETPINIVMNILTWSLHDNNESEAERENKKRKRMGETTQDSGTPIMQASQPSKDSATTVKLDFQFSSDVVAATAVPSVPRQFSGQLLVDMKGWPGQH